MRKHFVCDNFGAFGRHVSFEYGNPGTLFGHSHAFHWHGLHGHRFHGDGYKHHGPKHGPGGSRLHCHGPQSNINVTHGSPCNRLHGYGAHIYRHHGHGPHSNRQGPHSHGFHANEYLFRRPHGFGPHHLNRTCQPNIFCESTSYSKRMLFGGPPQYRRRCFEKKTQGFNRGHLDNLHIITPRPHSV